MTKKSKIGTSFFILLAAAAVIALPLRIYELLNIVAPDTGFYTKNSFTTMALYAVSAVVAFYCIIAALVSRKKLETCKLNDKSAAVSVFSVILAAAFAVGCAVSFSEFLKLYAEYIEQKNYVFVSQEKSLASTGAVTRMGEAIFALLSAVYFLFRSFIKPEKLKLFALTPVIWCIFRVIYRFMNTISYINDSKLFFEIIAIVFIMMYLMNFAQVSSKINDKEIKWKLWGYGIPAAFFALLCFVPRLALVLTGNIGLLVTGYSSAETIPLIDVLASIDICDGALAAYIISSLASIKTKK